MQALLDVFVLGLRTGDFDQFRFAQQFAGEFLDFAVQRCREQHGLAGCRGFGGDTTDRLDEAHVKHAVGFVQHQQFEARKIHLALIDEIDQAARGCNQHVERLFQQTALFRIRHAAEHRTGTHMAGEFAVFVDRFGDLHGEFAGRGQHQHARAAAMARGGQAQPLQRRQHKGCGFTGACRRRNHHVKAGQRDRNSLRLHGRRFGITRGGQGLQEGGVQIKGCKRHC